MDYLPKIDGIAGESLDAKHTGEIDLVSFAGLRAQQRDEFGLVAIKHALERSE